MPAVISRSRGRGRRTISEINMVPFIDVMLVLLIIFMVTAPLITPSLIDLPSVGKAARTPDQLIQITIGRDESLSLRHGDSQRPVGADQLLAQVRAAQGGQADLPVVISADRAVKYEVVVKVMDRLQRGGVSRVGLAVQLAP
jgi:biopolymer transport protein TolR